MAEGDGEGDGHPSAIQAFCLKSVFPEPRALEEISESQRCHPRSPGPPAAQHCFSHHGTFSPQLSSEKKVQREESPTTPSALRDTDKQTEGWRSGTMSEKGLLGEDPSGGKAPGPPDSGGSRRDKAGTPGDPPRNRQRESSSARFQLEGVD
ncbi:serine/arginine repetitive matrix protein 3-like isoform X2 [Caloenas nicobarica]|uniref:serine/arginine repetitive matrix protein 3-like isoform X2 n=1 Tax=Caloenas nicobarica TaxID=187106 RepID=UPI0032B7A098